MSKSSKQILITGGNGMVASYADFGIKLGKKQLNILNPLSIQKAIDKHKPSAILHLAALTDMLACQKNPKQAYQTNITGTQNIAKACQKNNIKLIYLSTCAVFNGKKKTPYRENDKPKPLNVYGKTKYQSELAAVRLSHNTLIVRTGWLFGGGARIDKKFVFSTFQKMNQKLAVQATSNRFGSPTYIPDLLKTIEKLIQKDAHGIFHVVNKGAVSYFEIAKEIKEIGKFNSPVTPVKALQIENLKLKRGAMEALSSSKIKLRPWKKALKEYLDLLP